MDDLYQQFVNHSINWIETDISLISRIPIPKDYKEKRIIFDNELIKFIRLLSSKGFCSEVSSLISSLWTKQMELYWLETKFKAELFVLIGSFFVGLGEAVLIVSIILLVVEAIENSGKVNLFSVIGIACPLLRKCKWITPHIDKIEHSIGTLSKSQIQTKFGTILKGFPDHTVSSNARSLVVSDSVKRTETFRDILNEIGLILQKMSKNPQITNFISILSKRIESIKKGLKSISVQPKVHTPIKQPTSSTRVNNLDTGKTYNLNFGNQPQNIPPVGRLDVGSIMYEGKKIQQRGISLYGIGYGYNPQAIINPW